MNTRIKSVRGTRSVSIREKAYLHIQQSIANGTLAAGSGVSELTLAEELGSSRTPIREAMSQLAAQGLLSPTPGGGMAVAQLSREDIIELYEIREALEVHAAGKIARIPLRVADRERLQALVNEIGELEKALSKSKMSALDEKQMDRFLNADLGFHALLMSMTHNSRLQKIINDMRLLISIFGIHRGGHDATSLKSIRESHQVILDAVARQDAAGAMKALAEHIQKSQQERLNEYDHRRRENSLRSAIPAFFETQKTA